MIVAPVLRFKEVGFNADVSLEDLGSAEKLITGFAPEVGKHIAWAYLPSAKSKLIANLLADPASWRDGRALV